MIETLLQPADCLFLFVDYQAGLAFGVESIARQAILNNAISLASTAMVFNAPIVASTSASKVYSGPLLPSLQAAMP
jgi:nicotinamidase-related amidase